MSRQKPSYTRLVLAARAIHETHYALRTSWCKAAYDEMMEIRRDPLNPKFLDLIIVELAATFDYSDAISLKIYIKTKLKIPEAKTIAEPIMRSPLAPEKKRLKDPIARAEQAVESLMIGRYTLTGRYNGASIPLVPLEPVPEKILERDSQLVWG